MAAATAGTDGTTDTPSVTFSDTIDRLWTQAMAGDYSAAGETVTKSLLPSLFYAAIGLGILFLGYLIAKYLSRMLSRPICRRVDETLGRFVGKVIFYVVLAGVTGSVLSKLGAPLGGLAAMLAAAGFAVGLAFQGTLSNFAAGVLMLVFRPFKVGDVVHAAGVMGKVNEIDLFTTTLDTPDNRRIIVPNSSIAGGTIENVSFHRHRRVEVVVGVEYAAAQDATRTALQRAIDEMSDRMIVGEDRGSSVVLARLGDNAVEWKVRLWVATTDYWAAQEALTGAVKRQLDAAEIGIPFPQLDVHVEGFHDHVEGFHGGSTGLPRIRPVRRDSRREAG